MQFSAAQLEEYQKKGYVIVDCPFPNALTQAALQADATTSVPMTIRNIYTF